MSKLIVFSFLWWLLGNPFLAIIVMLALVYIADRRFVGIFPSFIKPIQRLRMIRHLKQQILINPNDTSSKYELARLYIEKKNYKDANHILIPLQKTMDHSADYWIDLGTTYLYDGQLEQGEQYILQGLQINARAKYGQPYLVLAEKYSAHNFDKALLYLSKFREIHSSSCEAYYILSTILNQLGKKQEAKEALNETFIIYKALPKYKKRQERKWVIKSLIRKLSM